MGGDTNGDSGRGYAKELFLITRFYCPFCDQFAFFIFVVAGVSHFWRISLLNCQTRIPGNTIHAPFGIIQRKISLSSELCPTSLYLNISHVHVLDVFTRCNTLGASIKESSQES
jgi:hypothetical protein